MSGADNWIKLYRWWHEHLKLHSNDYLIDSQSSFLSNYSTNSSQIIKLKKRSTENSQLNHNDFRHVRDSIRGTNPLTTRLNPSTRKRLVYSNECKLVTMIFSVKRN